MRSIFNDAYVILFSFFFIEAYVLGTCVCVCACVRTYVCCVQMGTETH